MIKILHKLINIINNTKLRRKLVISYLIISLVPLFFVSFWLIKNANDIIIEQTTNSYRASLQQLTNNINNELINYMDISRHIYFNRTLNNYLQKEYKDILELIEANDYIKDNLEGYLKYRNDLRKIIIYTANYKLFTGGSYMVQVNSDQLANTEYQSISKSGINGYWGKPKAVSSENNYWDTAKPNQKYIEYEFVFSYNLNMNYSSNNPANILSLEIREKQLYKLMEAEGIDNEIYVFNADGIIMTTNKRDMLGKSIASEKYFNMLKRDQKGNFLWTNSGNQFEVMFNTTNNGWKIVSLISFHNIIKQTSNLLNFAIVLIFISMVFSMLIIYWISRLLVKRLNVLLRHINEMNDSNIPIDQHLDGDDEIGILDRDFIKMAEKTKYLIEEVYILNIKKKEAELNALQAQINPHFLYNTLSMLNWMTLKCSGEQIREVVNNIAKFYRISLSKGKEIITVEKEVECIKAYLEIQHFRTMDRIRSFINIQDEILDIPVLKLTLQPLVENSIEHGIYEDKNELCILIKGWKEEQYIILEVTDDGIGIEEGILESLMNGTYTSSKGSAYGLKNVDQRIKLHFGDKYGLIIKSSVGVGTTVRIILPFKKAD